MPLSIKDPEVDRLARTLIQRTGETLTQAVIVSLRERLEREQRKSKHNVDLENLVTEVLGACHRLKS